MAGEAPVATAGAVRLHQSGRTQAAQKGRGHAGHVSGPAHGVGGIVVVVQPFDGRRHGFPSTPHGTEAPAVVTGAPASLMWAGPGPAVMSRASPMGRGAVLC